MPLNPSSLSVKQATAALARQRTHAEGLLRYTDRQRHERLQRFLAQQRAVGAWADSCSALVDAVQHGVRIGSDDIHTAMQTCGTAGARDAVRQLFYRGFKTWRIAKSAASELAFVQSCAASGDFRSANHRLHFLMQRHDDTARGVTAGVDASNPVPRIGTELVAAYLECAVHAATSGPSVGRSPATDGHGAQGTEDAWSAALGTFVSLRRNPHTQSLVTPTPQVLERLSQLAEHGGQWRAAVQIITGASMRHLLVPPESYDAAIRCCYGAQRHPLVVALVRRCLATKSAPDEASVRMALRSTEEAVAGEGLAPLMSDLPMMLPFATAHPGIPAQLTADADGRLGAVRPDTWALAVKLYEGLRDNGLALLPQTFEGPLRTCCASGQWAVAANLLNEMKRFQRRIPVHAYRSVALSKLEHCTSYEAARGFLETPVLDRRNPMTYAALLRCCLRNDDLVNFKRVSTEMKRLELPETYETIKLLILAAFAQKNPHGVVTRYVRWLQLTQHETSRVAKDDVVPLHASDFAMEPPMCRLVLSACEHLIKESKRSTTFRLDPVVWVAHKDVLKRLSGGKELLEGGGTGTAASASDPANVEVAIKPWLFANTSVPSGE